MKELEKEFRQMYEDAIFQEEKRARLYDRGWCKDNGISYVEPDIQELEELVYQDISSQT